VRKVIPEPYYGPAFHDQPILAIDKVHYVGEPVAVVLAADPHVAEEAAQLIVAEYEELPAIFDEVEAADNKDPGASGAQARRHLRRSSSISRAARAPISRSISSSGAATSTRPSPRPRKSSSTPSARRRSSISRSSRSHRSGTGRRRA
jgi:CO/xanthine dehydrogenase Mo-binding subunit